MGNKQSPDSSGVGCVQASYAALGPSKAQLPLPPMSPDGITSTVPPAAEPSGVSIPASRPFDAAQVSSAVLHIVHASFLSPRPWHALQLAFDLALNFSLHALFLPIGC